jgi:hypothetical protein
MALQFRKPQEARAIEARGRARSLGVRVEVVAAGREYRSRSQSHSHTMDTVRRTPVGWTCDCPGFTYTNCCKHVAQVERRSEREGWPFGRIARPT